MKIRRTSLLIIALSVLLSTTGCWDSVDVNKKSLITLVITDKQEDEYVFYTELPNMAKGEAQNSQGTGGGSYSYLTGRGERLADARIDLDRKMGKRVFLGTALALILTDAMAREDLILYMNRMESNVEYRKALRIVITHDAPENILSANLKDSLSVGKAISDIIQSMEFAGEICSYSAMEILEFLYEKECFILPDIGLVGENIAAIGYVIIQDGKYVDRIRLEDSMGLLFLLSDNGAWKPTIMLNDLIVGTKVTLKNRKITPVYKDGKLELNVVLNFESKIKYLNRITVLDDTATEKIEQELKAKLRTEIEETIAHSKEIGCDYLGFKNAFRLKYPNDARQLDWDAAYRDSEVHLTVNTTLEAEGMLDYKNAPKE